MDCNTLFSAGYDPQLWYAGYNESWILGAQGPPWQISCSRIAAEKKPDPKPEGPIELYMPLCCDRCVEKVYKKLKLMEGVASVECNVEKQKVTVSGPAKPAAVLKMAKKIKENSSLWKDKYPPKPSKKKGKADQGDEN